MTWSAVALALVVGVALFGVASASAGQGQLPPSTNAPPFPTPTTAGEILVPGATTAAVPTTAPSAPTSARPEPTTQEDNQDSDAGRTVWMAIIGLLVVALLILLLTVVYARHTQPSRRTAWEDDEDRPLDDDPFTPTAARSVFEGSSQDEQTFWWAED